jgi:hypothetical protein
MPIIPKFRVAKINHKPKSFSVTDDDEDPLPKSEKKTRKKGGKKSGPVYIDDSGSSGLATSTVDRGFDSLYL